MKERRGGGREGKEPRRREGRGRITTRACEKTAAGKSVSDHLPAGMHDFVFLKAAALQKGSCLVSTATKAQLWLYLCAWYVPARTGAAPEQLTPELHQGREHGANLGQTSPQIEN